MPIEAYFFLIVPANVPGFLAVVGLVAWSGLAPNGHGGTGSRGWSGSMFAVLVLTVFFQSTVRMINNSMANLVFNAVTALCGVGLVSLVANRYRGSSRLARSVAAGLAGVLGLGVGKLVGVFTYFLLWRPRL